jgi:hypothetical protein
MQLESCGNASAIQEVLRSHLIRTVTPEIPYFNTEKIMATSPPFLLCSSNATNLTRNLKLNYLCS